MTMVDVAAWSLLQNMLLHLCICLCTHWNGNGMAEGPFEKAISNQRRCDLLTEQGKACRGRCFLKATPLVLLKTCLGCFQVLCLDHADLAAVWLLCPGAGPVQVGQ